MTIARQLYELQEIDLELEASEQVLTQLVAQLGESQAIVTAQNRLSRESQHLEEVRQQQHSTEWETDDLTVKLAGVEEKLYGGRITNPKELANLQHEADGLKKRRSQVEDKTLEIMEQVSGTETRIAALGSDLKRLEAEWENRQQQLLADSERYRAIIAALKQKRQLVLAAIDSPAVSVYDQAKRQKGRAVAKVERGTCRGCGISLSTAQLQQTGGDRLVNCSNCGRILFLT